MVTTAALNTMVEKGEWTAVVEECERLELQLEGPEKSNAALLLLAHLLLNDIPSAALVWKRAGEEERRVGSALALAWDVAQHMRRHEHSGAHRAAAALHAAGGLPGTAALALAREYRERTFALLSEAYANIPLSQCASCLGLSYAHCKEYVTARGWECKAAADEELLVVRVQGQRKQQTVGLEQLRQLVEYSVFLES